mmetsp:Transcript_2160/g.3183  ORF Transcript_2160/g.3183 Transcript_2160/m.3183 type:complete len:224 (-) Transcript_2160:967-1638(-)
MQFTTHVHHFTSLHLEHIQEPVTALLVLDPHSVVHQSQPLPAIFSRLGAKHGMGTEYINFRGKRGQHTFFGMGLHTQHIHQEFTSQLLQREGLEDVVKGQDAGGNQHHVQLLLEEGGDLEQGEELHPQLPGLSGLVRLTGSIDVEMLGEGFGQELPKISEANNTNLQPSSLSWLSGRDICRFESGLGHCFSGGKCLSHWPNQGPTPEVGPQDLDKLGLLLQLG